MNGSIQILRGIRRVLLQAALCGGVALGQSVDGLEKQVDTLFAQYGATTPGVAVAVIQDGKTVLKKGYGSASLEHGSPVTETTVFQVGSVSKQFTAFAIYLLEKQRKLSLEDAVQKYIPEIPGYGQPVRIKHLLAHTSGIRDHAALLSLAGWRMDDVMTASQALRLLGRQKELNFPPGSAYLYSNGGYVLLAEIVRRVSGESLASFARRNIFEPLRMNDTRFCDDHELVIRNRADSYERDQGTYKRVNLNDAIAGPSNLYTTAADLAKWMLNFEEPVAGDRDLIRRFNEPSVLNNGERVVYYSLPGDVGYHAKGQIQRSYRGLDVLSHGGHAGGFRSTLWRFPRQRFAFVLLSNDEHFAQLSNAEAIAGIYLKGALAPEQKGAAPAPAPAAEPGKSRAAPADFEGRYFNAEIETAYTVKVVNGKPVLGHLRHGDIPLTAAGPDAFTGRIVFPARLEFTRDAAGKVVELRISNFGAKNVRFRKSPGARASVTPAG